ncbi:MAG: RNA 3'-terminal phosphate cyclase [Candidatus Hodarchaeales archaeon]|jgi:RNA 3'-phosphate cyclase
MHLIDGSQGEGGGSVLRIATAFALVNQETITIKNIRKKRPVSGLRPQHLLGLQALTDLCGGELIGGEIGSERITFHPGSDWKTNLVVTIPTAGSIGLVLQILQIGMLASANLSVALTFQGGGTYGKWAPSIDYIQKVTWEIFKQMNYYLELSVSQHGFFPKGGAQVNVSMNSPQKLTGVNLITGNEINEAIINSIATTHLKNARVAERQAEEIQYNLAKQNIDSTPNVVNVKASNPGSGVLVYSSTGNTIIAGDAVGEKGKPAEKVGQIAFNNYFSTLSNDCSVDRYLADQILPVMALARSSSTFTTPTITKHTQTNIDLIEALTHAKVSIEKLDNKFHLSIDV